MFGATALAAPLQEGNFSMRNIVVGFAAVFDGAMNLVFGAGSAAAPQQAGGGPVRESVPRPIARPSTPHSIDCCEAPGSPRGVVASQHCVSPAVPSLFKPSIGSCSVTTPAPPPPFVPQAAENSAAGIADRNAAMRWLSMAENGLPQARQEAYEALESLAPDFPESIPALVRGLGDRDAYWPCKFALRTYGPAALDELLRAVAGDDRRIRSLALPVASSILCPAVSS